MRALERMSSGIESLIEIDAIFTRSRGWSLRLASGLSEREASAIYGGDISRLQRTLFGVIEMQNIQMDIN